MGRVTTTKTINAVIARDGDRCVIAGPHCLGDALYADHRANRGNGGSKVLDSITNLIAACALCNGGKEDADGEYRADLIARGVRIEKDSTNAKTVERARTTPVTFPDGSRWLLLDDGTRTNATREEGG